MSGYWWGVHLATVCVCGLETMDLEQNRGKVPSATPAKVPPKKRLG